MKRIKKDLLKGIMVLVIIFIGILVINNKNKSNQFVSNKYMEPAIKKSNVVKPVYKLESDGSATFKASFSDSGSGVNKIEYYVSTSSSKPGSSAGWSTTDNYTLTCNKQYYIFARAVDKVGNVSVINDYFDSYYENCGYPTGYPEGVVPQIPTPEQIEALRRLYGGETPAEPTCEGSCYLSNNAADWTDVHNSDLPADAKTALQNALHADNENYNANNANNSYSYDANGVWTDASGAVQNDKGSTSGNNISVSGSTYTMNTSNGNTITYDSSTGTTVVTKP